MWCMGCSLVPRLSPDANENILQAIESWAGPGNQATWGGVMQELEEIDNLAKRTLTHR